MRSLATTKLSSKGQVVIPQEIRGRLGLKCGVEFVVLGERDVVILKSIAPPDAGFPRARAPRPKCGAKGVTLTIEDKAGKKTTLEVKAAVKSLTGGAPAM